MSVMAQEVEEEAKGRRKRKRNDVERNGVRVRQEDVGAKHPLAHRRGRREE